MPTRIPIPCSGETHYITVTDDYELEVDPEKHDVELELSLGAIGGEMSKCVKLVSDIDLRSWVAVDTPGLTPDQRFKLAMASDERWRGMVARDTPDLTGDQRRQLLEASK